MSEGAAKPKVIVVGAGIFGCSVARPSFVTAHEPRLLSVFSGKIDHCLAVAAEVRRLLAPLVS